MFAVVRANRTRIGSQTDQKKHIMPHDWKGREDVVAAGTSCPMPNCGALTIAYRSADDLQYDDTAQWEFTCSRCGIEFTVPKDDLVFRSVPTQWLFANVEAAQL